MTGGLGAVVIVGLVLLAVYTFRRPDQRQPYRPMDISAQDFDVRALVTGFVVAVVTVSLTFAVLIAGSAPPN